jgi:hypothetical protein
MLSYGGCFHSGARPSCSQPRMVFRSTPISAAMRLIVAPSPCSRAASSYWNCRRARDAALACCATVGLDGGEGSVGIAAGSWAALR